MRLRGKRGAGGEIGREKIDKKEKEVRKREEKNTEKNIGREKRRDGRETVRERQWIEI